MPIIEGGLNISASIGRGPKVAEPFTPSEARAILEDSHSAYIKEIEARGLGGTRQPNHLEMNIPMKL